MLPELVPPEEHGGLSGFGLAIGRVGSIAAAARRPFFQRWALAFGKLSNSTMAILRTIMSFTSHGGRIDHPSERVFSLLLCSLTAVFFLYHDRNPAPRATRVDSRLAVREAHHTIHDPNQHPGMLRFILAFRLLGRHRHDRRAS
jgi:hypothetical protein